jgi:hypothetical protein
VWLPEPRICRHSVALSKQFFADINVTAKFFTNLIHHWLETIVAGNISARNKKNKI